MVKTKLLIQARMSSRRLPKKVLLPVNGKPLIIYLVDEIRKICAVEDIYVLTSDSKNDDELCEVLVKNNVNLYRGNLENVYERYRGLLNQIDCDYFFRICADSPFLPTYLITLYKKLIGVNPGVDIISNVVRRTFPSGYSLELVKKEMFMSKKFVKSKHFSQEHVTSSFYGRKSIFRGISVETCQEFDRNYAIDSLEDYNRLKSAKEVEQVNQSDFKIVNNYVD